MKKIIRISALLLIAALTALSLCSCQSLDDQRSHHAFYTDDDHLKIEFEGNTYHFIYPGTYTIINDNNIWNDTYYVTENDVPVLLSGWYGNYMYINKDKTIIETSVPLNELPDALKSAISEGVDKTGDTSHEWSRSNNYVYYIREDKYDKIESIIEDGEPDHYYFEFWSYSDYDLDYDDMDLFAAKSVSSNGHRLVMLADDLTAVINKALKSKGDDQIDFTQLGSDAKMIDISRCDSEMILTDWKEYYLIKDKEHYYFWNGNTQNGIILYRFTEDEASAVRELFKDFPDAVYENDFSIYYPDDDYEDDYADSMMGV